MRHAEITKLIGGSIAVNPLSSSKKGFHMKRYACSITLLLTLCLTLSGHTQTEGVSRQVSALRAAMESFANDAKARIEGLEARENLRTACNNQGRVYWPSHPDANGGGCVAHEDLATGNGNFCEEQTVRWPATRMQGYRPGYGYIPPGSNCTFKTPVVPEGFTVTATDPDTLGYCQNGSDNSGHAKITCEDGAFVITEPVCAYERYNHGDCR